MKTIQLQRRGVSDTLTATFKPDGRRHNKYYFIEIGKHRSNNSYFIKIDDYFTCRGRALFFEYAETFEAAKTKAGDLLKKETCKDVEFSDFIEGYCFPFGLDCCGVVEWEERQANDKYLAHCYYEPYSDTIRHAVFNYCLVSFNGASVEQPELKIDAATHHWDKMIEDVLASSWIHDCDRDKGELYCKGRLAWLLSETFKESRPEKAVVLPSIVQGDTRGKYAQDLKKVYFSKQGNAPQTAKD